MISVVIPNFNKSNFLVDTINSIKSQTFKNLEVIIVDDFSTDNSMELISKFVENDKRFFVYKNKLNRGGSYCRNYGLEKANGDYVFFLDSDDILSANCLEDRFKIMQLNPELDFTVFPTGTFHENIGDSDFVWNNFKGNHLNKFLSHDLPWVICSVLWKKSFLKKLNGFNESFIRLQDVELHTRALMTENVNYNVFPNFKVDSFYRIDSGRINNYFVFCNNDIKGRLNFVSFFEKVLPIKIKRHLKGTLFTCYNSSFNAYGEGYIDSNQLKVLLSHINGGVFNKHFNILDIFILKIYILIRKNKLYFRGLDRVVKWYLIK